MRFFIIKKVVDFYPPPHNVCHTSWEKCSLDDFYLDVSSFCECRSWRVIRVKNSSLLSFNDRVALLKHGLDFFLFLLPAPETCAKITHFTPEGSVKTHGCCTGYWLTGLIKEGFYHVNQQVKDEYQKGGGFCYSPAIGIARFFDGA